MVKQILVLAVVLVGVIALSVAVPKLLSARGEEEALSFQVVTPSAAKPSPFQPLVDTGLNADGSTPTLDPLRNCTYTYYYWLQRPGSFPAEIVINKQTITAEEGLALITSTDGSVETLITRQLYITYLNLANGADIALVKVTIMDVENWLAQNAGSSGLSEFQNQAAITLATTLDAYNNGLFGPGMCPNQPPTPLPSTTLTPTRLPSSTPRPRYYNPGSGGSGDDDDGGSNPRPTSTRRATSTPRPTLFPTVGTLVLPTVQYPTLTTPTPTLPGQATSTSILPTFTIVPPTATQPDPTATQPDPTATDVPATSTPVPPTYTPRPTNTPKPSKTPRP